VAQRTSSTTSLGTWLSETPKPYFLKVLHCNQVSISSRFRDIGPKHIGSQFKLTWCHRSRDHSIYHMTFPMGVVLNWASVFNRFWDIQPTKNLTTPLVKISVTGEKKRVKCIWNISQWIWTLFGFEQTQY